MLTGSSTKLPPKARNRALGGGVSIITPLPPSGQPAGTRPVRLFTGKLKELADPCPHPTPARVSNPPCAGPRSPAPSEGPHLEPMCLGAGSQAADPDSRGSLSGKLRPAGRADRGFGNVGLSLTSWGFQSAKAQQGAGPRSHSPCQAGGRVKRTWPGSKGEQEPTVQSRGEGASQDPGLPRWSAPETEAPAVPRHQLLPGLDAGYCLNRRPGQGACFCPQQALKKFPRACPAPSTPAQLHPSSSRGSMRVRTKGWPGPRVPPTPGQAGRALTSCT